MQITNGTVERVYKPGDYESRRVALSFNIDPGEDYNAILEHVSGLAETHARQIPGEAVPPTTRGKKGAVTSPIPAIGTSVVTAPSATAAPASLVAPTVLPPAPTPVASAPVALPTPPAPLSAVGTAPMPEAAPVPPTHPAAVAPPAPAAPVSLPAAPAGPLPSPVSGSADPRFGDTALSDACAHKVNGAGDRRQAVIDALMPLRAEFTGNPALTVASIPYERRGEFLSRLAAL